MDLDEFIKSNASPGVLPDRNAPGGHDAYYSRAVMLLGGPEAFRPHIPFDVETLKKSYARDRHFNDGLTPIRRWDAATGIRIPDDRTGPKRPIAARGSLWPLLLEHHVTSLSQSQAVYMLKMASEMLIGVNACASGLKKT